MDVDFEVFSEDDDHICFKAVNKEGISLGMMTVSLKYRGWQIGCASYFSSDRGLTKVSSNGRGWKDRLVAEGKAGLLKICMDIDSAIIMRRKS